MPWKYSQFNLLDKIYDDAYSLYNTASQSHVIVNTKKPSLRHILSPEKSNLLPQNVLEDFISKGFIIDYDLDELSKLKQQLNIIKQNLFSGLNLSILTTLKCNFRCSYCFENLDNLFSHLSMNEFTQHNLTDFIEQKIQAGDVKGYVKVKWFGGEPLIAEKVMFNLSYKIKKLAELNNLKYDSILVTNGYFLNKLNKVNIEQLNLAAIHVTLDGTKEVHDKRRILKGGGHTFERIINNILEISNYFPKVSIRINADKTNANDIPKLFKQLRDVGLLEKCRHNSICYVDTEIGKYSLESNCSALLREHDIVDIYSTISSGLSENNLNAAEYLEYPRVLPMACDAQMKEYYVIDPHGNVFKCSGDVTILDRKLFNINSMEHTNLEENRLMSVSPFSITKCRKCALLPICHGGCPAKHMDLNSQNTSCPPFCYTIRQKLIKLAKRTLV